MKKILLAFIVLEIISLSGCGLSKIITNNNTKIQKDRIFVNEGILFTRTGAVEFFGETEIKKNSNIPIENYKKLDIIRINLDVEFASYNVAIMKKEKPLPELLKKYNINYLKHNILIVEYRRGEDFFDKQIELNYNVPNTINSAVIISFEGGIYLAPVINILLETKDYLIGIYKESTCRMDGKYLQGCKNVMENTPGSTPYDDFLYYKNALENNEIFKAEIEKEILDTIKLFEVIKK